MRETRCGPVTFFFEPSVGFRCCCRWRLAKCLAWPLVREMSAPAGRAQLHRRRVRKSLIGRFFGVIPLDGRKYGRHGVSFTATPALSAFGEQRALDLGHRRHDLDEPYPSSTFATNPCSLVGSAVSVEADDDRGRVQGRSSERLRLLTDEPMGLRSFWIRDDSLSNAEKLPCLRGGQDQVPPGQGHHVVTPRRAHSLAIERHANCAHQAIGLSGRRQ